MDAQILVTGFSLFVVKPMLIVFLALLTVMVLHKSSPARQHFVLVVGILAVLSLPLLHTVLPTIEWPVLSQIWQADSRSLLDWLAQKPVLLSFAGVSWLPVLLAVYACITLWLIFYLILGITLVVRETRQAQRCDDLSWIEMVNTLCEQLDIERSVQLRINNHSGSPYTWGSLRPVIVLPASALKWSEQQRQLVLIHELAHVARHDWLTGLTVRLCCAFFWFLPPLWLACSRLFYYAELACDDHVYRLTGQRASYAETLLVCANTHKLPDHPALTLVRRSPLFRRIQAVLDQQRARHPVSQHISQYGVLTVITLLLPLACIQAVPIPPAEVRVIDISLGNMAGSLYCSEMQMVCEEPVQPQPDSRGLLIDLAASETVAIDYRENSEQFLNEQDVPFEFIIIPPDIDDHFP